MKYHKGNQLRNEKNGLTLIRKLFARLKSPKRVFSWIKHQASDEQFSAVTAVIPPSSHALSKYIYGLPFPQTWSELWQREFYYTGDIQIEMRWMTVSLAKHAKAIHELISIKKQIENDVVLGKYVEANERLGFLEERYGKSIFAIQCRLLLAELQDGLGANAKMLSDIEEGGCDPIVYLLANYLSMRAERNVSPDSFTRKLDRDLKDAGLPEKWIEYFHFRLNFLELNSWDHLASLLNFDNPLSLVDRYIQFVSVIQLVLTSQTSVFHNIMPEVGALAKRTGDQQLNNLVLFFEHGEITSLGEHSIAIIRALDLLYTGRYAECAQISENLLHSDPLNFAIYRLYVQACLFSRKNATTHILHESFCNLILSALSKILGGVVEHSRASEDLMKIALTVGDNSLSISINNFLVDQKLKVSFLPNRLSEPLVAHTLTPELAFLFENARDSEVFIKKLSKQFSNSIYLNTIFEYFSSVNERRLPLFDNELVEVQRNLWTARAAEKIGEYKLSNRYYSVIKTGSETRSAEVPAFVNDEAIVGMAASFLGENRFAECAQLLVKALLDNPTLTRKLPIEYLIQRLEQEPDEVSLDDINIPVLYALAEAEPRAIYIAYDNFFSAIGVVRPTSFIHQADKYERRLLSVFLHKVCIPKVLSCSYHFEGTDDLEQERLKICQFLSQLNPAESKMFSGEINDITERVMIRKGMQQIEESRIYVDEIGIRSRGKKLFFELYERFRAFSRLQMTNPEIKITDATRILSYFVPDENGMLIEKPVPEVRDAINVGKVLHIASIGHFRDLFFEVRNRFISNNEHGLDAYLSTRVRHGTLEGHVRSVFERLNLLAQRDKSTDFYLEVNHWNGRLGPRGPLISVPIQKLIAEFSGKIDAIIDYLKKRVVQVNVDGKSEDTWLNFSFSDAELIQLLTTDFDPLVTFDEYIDEIFRVLWDRTNTTLGQTRSRISGKIKDQVYNALLELLRGVRQLVIAGDAPELHGNITRGFTDLQNEIDRLAQWFTISYSTKLDEFSMSDIVHISIASINNIYPSRTIQPELFISGDHSYQGRLFAHFSDIFRTLFDNIVIHSGLVGAELKIQVSIVSDANSLYISVINNLAANVVSGDPVGVLRRKLELVFGAEAVQPIVRSEGGSGLAKIVKILRSDLARKAATISVDYYDESTIQMKIQFELEGLLMPHNL